MQRLDSDLLRSFLAVAEAGSVTGGAARIHRSQSAASLQIRQLEAILGQAVFARHGRGVTLTAVGARLLPVARQVTARLDATLAALRDEGLAGRLCIGLPDDQSRTALSRIVADFARDHPRVELTVQCALSTGFPQALSRGELDIAVHEVPSLGPRMELLREQPMIWVASPSHEATRSDPLPVALFDRACWWRDAALAALDASGRAYRVAFSSESSGGVLAAVEAGIAVGLMDASALRTGLVRVADLADAEPPMSSKLVIERGRSADESLARTMAQALRRAFIGGGSDP